MKCCLLLFYWTIMNHFSIRLWCVMKSRFYTTTGDDQLSGWADKKVQSTSQSQNLHPKMVMVTVWWSAASLIHYNFLNPGETITSEKYAQKISEIYQKLQCLQLVLVNRKGPITQIFSMTIPDHTLHNLHFKSWTICTKNFCLIHHIHLTSCPQTTTF